MKSLKGSTKVKYIGKGERKLDDEDDILDLVQEIEDVQAEAQVELGFEQKELKKRT